jgi:hypothetical protein
MELSEIMVPRGFEWDPTGWGTSRWTHFELEITCLRQPYMSDLEWEREQRRCAAIADQKLGRSSDQP